jgi:hypothetical protein
MATLVSSPLKVSEFIVSAQITGKVISSRPSKSGFWVSVDSIPDEAWCSTSPKEGTVVTIVQSASRFNKVKV